MYFPETSKLLFEPDFIKFLSQINEWYLEENNRTEYDNGVVFGYDITFEKWFDFANNLDFIGIALLHVKRDFIHKDWEAFNPKIHELALINPKQFSEEFIAIEKEVTVLKGRISHKDYLKPISKELIEMLDRIVDQYKEYNMSKPSKSEITGNIEPLYWNGGVGSLATLFHDLRTSKSGRDAKPYLDYTPKQIQDFISKNFVDEAGNPFPEDSLKTYLDPKRTDKKVKRNRIDITDVGNE